MCPPKITKAVAFLPRSSIRVFARYLWDTIACEVKPVISKLNPHWNTRCTGALYWHSFTCALYGPSYLETYLHNTRYISPPTVLQKSTFMRSKSQTVWITLCMFYPIQSRCQVFDAHKKKSHSHDPSNEKIFQRVSHIREYWICMTLEYSFLAYFQDPVGRCQPLSMPTRWGNLPHFLF